MFARRGTPTVHCDLSAGQPGSNSGDAAGPPPDIGFGAQVGFRVPNMVVSPFARKHYVSHIPMDHTAVIKFVEDRFIGNGKYLTARDAAQPNLLDFFDFTGVPWATPPTPPDARLLGTAALNPCTSRRTSIDARNMPGPRPSRTSTIASSTGNVAAPGALAGSSVWQRSRLQASTGTTSNGRIMSLSSCSSMWQWKT